MIDLGTNVVSMGYPLPNVRVDPDGGVTHLVSFRLLKGYPTHMPIIERDGYPPAPSLELDMPAPLGLSGGPLLHADDRNLLLGVVFGTHGVERIESFASVDPETGERTPEVLDVVSFALAHDSRTLGSLRGPATDGQPLRAMMQRRGEVFERLKRKAREGAPHGHTWRYSVVGRGQRILQSEMQTVPRCR